MTGAFEVADEFEAWLTSRYGTPDHVAGLSFDLDDMLNAYRSARERTAPQPAPELRAAMAETRHLRADLRTLADLWDASAGNAEKTAQRPNRARLVLEEQASTFRKCAADIRKLAGPAT